MVRIFMISFVVLSFIPSAWAQDKVEDIPKSEFLMKVEAFTEGLNPRDARHFNILYGNYNIVKIVEGIRKTVGETVDKCGDENPDMKDQMDDRFGVWKEAIEPIIDEAEDNIDNMVMAQDYAKEKDIRRIFKDLEKERERAESQVQKIPVTSKEGCEFVLKQMDNTQEKLTDMLRSTLVTLPRTIQEEDTKEVEAEKAAAAEAEAQAKAAAEAEAEAEEAEHAAHEDGEEEPEAEPEPES